MEERPDEITVKIQELRDLIYASREVIANIELLHNKLHRLKDRAEDFRDKFERIISEGK